MTDGASGAPVAERCRSACTTGCDISEHCDSRCFTEGADVRANAVFRGFRGPKTSVKTLGVSLAQKLPFIKA